MLPSGGTARLLSLLPMRGGAWGRSLGSRHAVACPLAERRERRTRECLLALLRVSELHVHDPPCVHATGTVCDGPLAVGPRSVSPSRLSVSRSRRASSVRRFRVRGCAFVCVWMLI